MTAARKADNDRARLWLASNGQWLGHFAPEYPAFGSLISSIVRYPNKNRFRTEASNDISQICKIWKKRRDYAESGRSQCRSLLAELDMRSEITTTWPSDTGLIILLHRQFDCPALPAVTRPLPSPLDCAPCSDERPRDIRRSNRPCATRCSTASVFPAFMFLPKLNLTEPPQHGPICPLVWEGRGREASPYPDRCPLILLFNSNTLQQHIAVTCVERHQQHSRGLAVAQQLLPQKRRSCGYRVRKAALQVPTRKIQWPRPAGQRQSASTQSF